MKSLPDVSAIPPKPKFTIEQRRASGIGHIAKAIQDGKDRAFISSFLGTDAVFVKMLQEKGYSLKKIGRYYLVSWR